VEQLNFNLEAIMDRHFLIPATIAAALHAGLLFGIRPSKPDLSSAAAEKPVIIELIKNLVEFTLEPTPAEDTEKSSAQRPPEAAPPVLPEPPPINPAGGFELKVPETPPNICTVPVTTVPLGPFGPPTDLPIGPGIATTGILNGIDLDRTPRTRSQTPPAYPFEAKKEGRSGTVTVEFVVDESGGVLSPQVVNSTDPVFNDSALRAIARWRFEPGKRDGRVVRFKMAVPVVFSLNAE
jgi:protein TonB